MKPFQIDISSMKVKKFVGFDLEFGLKVRNGSDNETIQLPINSFSLQEKNINYYCLINDTKDGFKRPYQLKKGADQYFIGTDQYLYSIDDNKFVVAEFRDLQLKWEIGEAKKYDPKSKK